MSISERFAFFSQVHSNFEHTGGIQPSSRYLAEAMAEPLRRFRITDAITPVRILEIGPGTGAITRAICTCMGPQDELDCYEINEEFVRYLVGAIQQDEILAPVAEQIRIHHAPAQELAKGDRFDFAICSAPLNNFDAATINAILEPMLAAVTGQGTATLFEYILFPALLRTFAQGVLRTRMREAQSENSQCLKRCGRSSMLVLRNLPPARVHEFGPFIGY